MNASLYRLNELFHGATVRARTCYNRSNPCKHVLDAVVELSDQQVLVFPGLSPLSEQCRKNICAEGGDRDGNVGCQDTVADRKGRIAELTDTKRCCPNDRE